MVRTYTGRGTPRLFVEINRTKATRRVEYFAGRGLVRFVFQFAGPGFNRQRRRPREHAQQEAGLKTGTQQVDRNIRNKNNVPKTEKLNETS